MIDRSASVNNGDAGVLASGAGTLVLIGHSTVTGNLYGLFKNSGVINSYGTNKVNGNGTEGEANNIIPMR